MAASELARRLNCAGETGQSCISCCGFAAGSYPDFIILQPEERPSITIEQVRQLSHQLSLSPYRATGRRVVVIDGAHLLTLEAQNALLKLIEEPPSATSFILVAESLEALLPTVRSRLVAIYFAPVATADIANFLVTQHGVAGPEAARLAELAEGAPGLAVTLARDEAAAIARTELAGAASTALTATIFERLLLARKLAESKADLANWARSLQRALIAELRHGATPPPRTAARLSALEHFRRSLEANLAPRVALERLMLEL